MNKIRRIQFMGNPFILMIIVFLSYFFWPLMAGAVCYFVVSTIAIEEDIEGTGEDFVEWYEKVKKSFI